MVVATFPDGTAHRWPVAHFDGLTLNQILFAMRMAEVTRLWCEP